MSRLAQVFASFTSEDPQAFEGLDFMTSTDPKAVADGLIGYMENELDSVTFTDDGMELEEFLREILHAYEYSDEELIEIGEAVIAKRRA